MLAQKLVGIAEALEKVGATMPAADLLLARVRLALCDCAEQALVLEQAQVPAAARLTRDDLASGKVTRLADARRRATCDAPPL